MRERERERVCVFVCVCLCVSVSVCVLHVFVYITSAFPSSSPVKEDGKAEEPGEQRWNEEQKVNKKLNPY